LQDLESREIITIDIPGEQNDMIDDKNDENVKNIKNDEIVKSIKNDIDNVIKNVKSIRNDITAGIVIIADEFDSKKIKIPSIGMKYDEKSKIDISYERESLVKNEIYKQMRRLNKPVSHNEICNYIIKHYDKKFTVDYKLVKKCLESLIDDEYIERSGMLMYKLVTHNTSNETRETPHETHE